jgi:hypothetical protein
VQVEAFGSNRGSPVGRLLLKFLTVVSLVAFVCLVYLWVRSRLVPEQFRYSGSSSTPDASAGRRVLTERSLTLWTGGGGIAFGWFQVVRTTADREEAEQFEPRPAALEHHYLPGSGFPFWAGSERRGWRTLWVARQAQSTEQPSRRYTMSQGAMAAPYWLLILPTVLLPAWWVWRGMKARRRLRRQLCASCGYDLRASTGRCPECGTSAAGREKEGQAGDGGGRGHGGV